MQRDCRLSFEAAQLSGMSLDTARTKRCANPNVLPIAARGILPRPAVPCHNALGSRLSLRTNPALRKVTIDGGPAGLHQSLLMKRVDPAHHVTLPAPAGSADTFGRGVVFSDQTLDTAQQG